MPDESQPTASETTDQAPRPVPSEIAARMAAHAPKPPTEAIAVTAEPVEAVAAAAATPDAAPEASEQEAATPETSDVVAPNAELSTPEAAVIERGAGRVDAGGTVHVRSGDGWRKVGQFPDATPEEALVYFERKFQDLEGQVRLVEQRISAGANAKDVAKAAAHLQPQIAEANAVGDLASLAARLDSLRSTLGELEAEQQAASRAEAEAAIAQREDVVVSLEKLAAGNLENVQWKQTMQRVDDLFTQWQSLQKDGPRVPKAQADALWKRFRDARSTLETARRRFFAELDAAHKDVRAKKQLLIEEARALAPKGADGIPAYRALLDRWKAAGRAGKKADDAMWADFKEAGDALFAAKAELVAVENEEYAANLVAKRELLDEAAPILQQTDRQAARTTLTGIQRRWDEIGKVPRESVRETEDALRKIEAHVRELEDKHWQSSNPERKARSEGLAGQLEDAIEKLEAEIAAETDAGRKSELEGELETKRSWLAVVAAS